eukprot:4196029-Prymnesium_polylepis.1
MTKRPGPGSDGSYSNVFGKLKETGRSLLKSDPMAVKQATALAAGTPNPLATQTPSPGCQSGSPTAPPHSPESWFARPLAPHPPQSCLASGPPSRARSGAARPP